MTQWGGATLGWLKGWACRGLAAGLASPGRGEAGLGLLGSRGWGWARRLGLGSRGGAGVGLVGPKGPA